MEKAKKSKIGSMLAYASADMLGGGVGQVISLYYLAFLTFVAGLPPVLAGLVTGIGKIWDGITDPIMGVIVDRTKTKWGACRPYLLIAVIPVFITYFMLWNTWGISSTAGKFVYFSFAYILYSTAFTVAVVPYEALLPKMVEGYSERTNYSSLRMIFSGVACVLSTYVYEWIIPANQPLSPALNSNYVTLGLVLGIFFALSILPAALWTKETVNVEEPAKKTTVREVLRDYKEILSDRTYRKCYGLTLLGAFMASAILSSLVIFVLLVYGNIEKFLLGFTLIFVIVNIKGAVEIGFFPVNVFLMKKYNKHRPYLLDLPLIIIAAVIGLFVTKDMPVWVFIAACALVGAGSSCLAFVPYTLLPDLADVDELMYGKRREGSNAGLTTMGRKIVAGLTLTLFGFIMEAFGITSDNASPEAATAGSLAAVKIMFSVIPIIACAAMIIISRTYSLNKDTHGLIKRLISEKKESGFASATDEEKAACEKITGMKYEKMWIAETPESTETE